MKRVGLLLLLCAACGTDAPSSSWRRRLADQDLTLEKLNAIVTAALAERFPEASLESKQAARIQVTFPDRSQVWCYLELLFSELEKETDVAARVRRVELRLQSIEEDRAAPDRPDRNAIVPLVRSDGYLEEWRAQLAQLGGSNQPLAKRRLVADLWILYALDTPKSIIPLHEDQVEQLGLDSDDLYRLAMANLERRMPQIESRSMGGFGMLVCGGNYESSLLLQTNLWKELAKDMKGSLVAAVPTRDLMVYADGGDPAKVAKLRTIVRKMHGEEDRPISRRLLRWTGEGWELLK